MNSLLQGHLLLLLLLVLLQHSTSGQETGEACLAQFKQGQDDFILDVDESVKKGAEFLSSPKLDRTKDCVSACCKHPKCNVAVMEKGAEEGQINFCFLFDCLYMKEYVCRLVRKNDYTSYVLDSVYESHMNIRIPPDDVDRPPMANGGPDRVVQPQDSVTLTGMLSKDDNKIVSHQWQMLTEYSYAVIEKTNFDDEIIVSNLTSGTYTFQLTVVDNVGQADSTKVTVLVLTPEQSEHHCMAPKKIGPCRGAFTRWHYNAASKKCEQFIFGGCRENLNNYLSKDKCTIACTGSEKSSKSGRGLPIPEPQGERCNAPCTKDEFTCANGCCLDPGLECDSKPQCSDGSDEQNCEDLDKKFRILLQIPVDEQKVRCTALAETGRCRDSATRWYYKPEQRECLPFNYGGCGGNDNRFETEETCLRVCHGVTEKDVFARGGEFEGRVAEGNTGVIAIAAVLGVAILVLFCILVYCLLKGKKKSSQHQRVPVNNAPVSFEDRERLVYNSTTKPI